MSEESEQEIDKLRQAELKMVDHRMDGTMEAMQSVGMVHQCRKRHVVDEDDMEEAVGSNA